MEPQLPQDSMAAVLPGPGGGQAARRAREAGAKGAGPKGAATEVAGFQDSASKESRPRSVSDAKPTTPTASPKAASGMPVAGASRATDAVTRMVVNCCKPPKASSPGIPSTGSDLFAHKMGLRGIIAKPVTAL